MTTKKIVGIVAAIVGALVLLVALFVGGITWFVFHTINSSDPAEAARTYLRGNELLKSDIGEVKDFGWFVTGNITTGTGGGDATLHLKVIGEKKTVNAQVDLTLRGNRAWRVTGASYEADGRTVDLMQAYEPAPPSK